MNDDTAVIYAYCYYKERSQQSLPNLFGGLLKQLLSLRNAVPADAKTLFGTNKGRHHHWTLVEVSSLLKAELERYRKAFIIVDALDEYSENPNNCDSLLAELEKLREYSNLMLTSRSVAPYMNAFRGASRVRIAAEDRDVRLYLESQIPALPKFVEANLDLQELIIQTITEAVEGMFLLASLHMQSLKDKVSMRKVKEALTQLPRGSGSAASKMAYDETMSRIRRQGKGFCDLAIATLSWISLAITPLSLRELQCALSVEPEDSAMDETNFVDKQTLSSACAGLVVVDHESQIVRLAHYTTQEYFESRKDVLFPDSQKMLAGTRLTYLSFNAFSNWRFKDRCSRYPRSRPLEPCRGSANAHHSLHAHYSSTPVDSWLSRISGPPHPENGRMAALERATTQQDYPLLAYAANHWHEHAYSSHDPTIQGLIINYLKRTENLAALLCPGGWYEENEDVRNLLFTQSIHGLPIAARYGFTDVVKALLHLEGYCAEDRSRIMAQALSLAAFYRQSSALRALLDGNTVPAAVSRALSFVYSPEVAPPGRCEVAKVLLNHGADANTVLSCIPLIHHASIRHDVQFTNILLSHGADVNLRDMEGGTALHSLAARAHCGDMVKLLLGNGLDINARSNSGETALLRAVRYCPPGEPKEYRSLITQLLGCGASVDQPAIVGWTALHWAAFNGRVKIACQPLEAGADLNARNGAGDAAADLLHWWDWKSITEEEKAECEEILERYNFYQSGEKRAVQDSVIFDWEPITSVF